MNRQSHRRRLLARMHRSLFGACGPIPQWLIREYQVRRRRDGVLVATVQTLEAALDLADRHHRHKKAALEVFLNDEPVLFVMSEHAQ